MNQKPGIVSPTWAVGQVAQANDRLSTQALKSEIAHALLYEPDSEISRAVSSAIDDVLRPIREKRAGRP